MAKRRITVIDGQGGGIGRALVEKIRQIHGGEAHIIALGTNALATSAMLKAGADEGATGENAIVVNVRTAECIMGAIGIIAADSMLGELTPAMAMAVCQSPARKILIPLNRCNLMIAGLRDVPFASLIDEAVAMAAEA